MGGFKISYQVTLPESADADAFEKFMTGRYLPAVRRGPTRVGLVTGLALWRAVTDTHASTHTFIVQMDFDGLAIGKLVVDDEEIQAEFDAFQAPFVRLAAYAETVVLVPEIGG